MSDPMDKPGLMVLDCTLRDGGYYNTWDFDKKLVESYLKAAAASGIDAVELGFRLLPKPYFLGPYAYTTDRFLEGLNIPQGLIPAVMVNAGDFFKAAAGPAATIRGIFSPREKSRLRMVRIAAHVADVEKCGPIVRTLKELGYQTTINIMQSNTCSRERLAELVRAAKGFDAVDVLYFADSLGNMGHEEIQEIVSVIKREWAGPIGFHGHDNVGKAVSNTLVAAREGITWLDGTIMGMGRGAGNAQMEYLLAELYHSKMKQVIPAPVIDLASTYFMELKKRYEWGLNVWYYISALHGVHPTYVQEMLAQNTFSPNDIAFLVQMLGETGSSSYKSAGVFEALASRFSEECGNWNARSVFAGRSALIVAGGAGAKRHWEGLESFIQSEKPVVVTLNQLSFVPLHLITAIAVCHPGRLVPFFDEAASATNKPLMTPFCALPQDLRARFGKREIWDYGMRVEPDVLRAGETGCTIPAVLVVPYALCAAIAGGARTIYLAGFDGYDGRDPRFHEMNRILVLIQQVYPDTPIVSLTATHYEVPQQSVYLY
ncbi:MAG: aldolase catalytic domain-containing protein [Syntrophobacteraceae bacterium]